MGLVLGVRWRVAGMRENQNDANKSGIQAHIGISDTVTRIKGDLV